MKFGVTFFFTDRSMRPDELARQVEARGFDSLYVAEHTHIPTARRTPAPMGEPLPEHYKRLLDPFGALLAAAQATSRLRVGTAILLTAQRDPIITAKEVATLDLLSGGRLTLGLGFGWNVQEIEDHGVPYKKRRDIAREKTLAMKALWTQDEAAFDGEFVSFESTWAWPKPVQKPHPPLILGGGAGPILFRHVVEYCDGWMPIGGRGVAAALPELRRLAEEAGRDPAALQITPVGSMPAPGKLERFDEIGVTETVFGLPGATPDEVLPHLDEYAKAIAEFGA